MKKLNYLLYLLIFITAPMTVACDESNADSTAGASNGSQETTNLGVADTTPPASPVKLVFMHHSVGSDWLADPKGDYGGGLGIALGNNNYFVRETDYDWSAVENPGIGSRTDIGQFSYWFVDTRQPQGNGEFCRDNIMTSVYNNTHKEPSPGYTDGISDPGGENEIVMFKSCYYNSVVRDDNAYGPDNIRRRTHNYPGHTLSNLKVMYNEMLDYFKTRPDKMFVLITSPPMKEESRSFTVEGVEYIWPTQKEADNGRELSNWLVGKSENGWLASNNWENKNVYVFDFFNVLTDPDNHHRVNDNGTVEHIIAASNDNFSAYSRGPNQTPVDNHPNQAGGVKATKEFVPLLNSFYHKWQDWKNTTKKAKTTKNKRTKK